MQFWIFVFWLPCNNLNVSFIFQLPDFPILIVRPSSITVNTSDTARLQCKGEALESPVTSWLRLTGEGALTVTNNDRVTVTAQGEIIIQVIMIQVLQQRQKFIQGWWVVFLILAYDQLSKSKITRAKKHQKKFKCFVFNKFYYLVSFFQ